VIVSFRLTGLAYDPQLSAPAACNYQIQIASIIKLRASRSEQALSSNEALQVLARAIGHIVFVIV
jgi:hypothetical protein